MTSVAGDGDDTVDAGDGADEISGGDGDDRIERVLATIRR